MTKYSPARRFSPASRQCCANADEAAGISDVVSSRNAATCSCRLRRCGRGRVAYAASRIRSCLKLNCWSPRSLETDSRRMRSRPSSESSSSARSSSPEDIPCSAPVQKTFPTTAASSNTARSPGGSASRRAATMPRMVVGSSEVDPVASSATEAASSSMNRGLPSPMRPISADSGRALCMWRKTWAPFEQVRTGKREQEERNVADARRQHLEEVEHARICPVDVLEDEHCRSVGRQRLDQPTGGEEERLTVADVASLPNPDQHRV